MIMAQRSPDAFIPDTFIDVVPESYPYRDEGCKVSPSCLKCPLPQCKYDDPGWLQRYRRQERDREVVASLRRNGLTVPEAAARFDLSPRTVFRILRRNGDGERQPAVAAS